MVLNTITGPVCQDVFRSAPEYCAAKLILFLNIVTAAVTARLGQNPRKFFRRWKITWTGASAQKPACRAVRIPTPPRSRADRPQNRTCDIHPQPNIAFRPQYTGLTDAISTAPLHPYVEPGCAAKNGLGRAWNGIGRMLESGNPSAPGVVRRETGPTRPVAGTARPL